MIKCEITEIQNETCGFSEVMQCEWSDVYTSSMQSFSSGDLE